MNNNSIKSASYSESSSVLESLLARLNELNEIGAALSHEKNIDRLLENILLAAKGITHADAGTLYLLDDELQILHFEILRNDTLNIQLGGTTGNPITFPPVPLYVDGQPNLAMVVSNSALCGETINIEDAYVAQGFDFSGTKKFDAKTGYDSRSFLSVPMRNHEHKIIGVLQLINALDPLTHHVKSFTQDDQQLVESLASQAAIALSNRRLIQQLEDLFESFIKLINTALDDKSPYNGGHCARVPALTMMLAEAAAVIPAWKMTEAEKYELKIAAMLHDCGKITTPVHVVDKSTKLHTLFDRIALVETRFEVLKRDVEITLLRAELAANGDTEKVIAARAAYAENVRQLEADLAFLKHCNLGSEKMADADQARVQSIGKQRWMNDSADVLSADEIENLTIRAGTLTAAEREIINHHIVVTIKLLEALPWPNHLKRVPEYAGGHHERMDGKGYPRGLTGEQMSVQARMMGIADIFEALTAKDRPYKPGKTLTESLFILGKFKEGGHIDPQLFDIFVREEVYLKYAQQFLDPAQIDAVDLSRIPGYTP